MLTDWHVTEILTFLAGDQADRPPHLVLPQLSLSLVCSGFINMLILLLGCTGPHSPGLWLISAVAAGKRWLPFCVINTVKESKGGV